MKQTFISSEVQYYSMIKKCDLKGRSVAYIDDQGKHRCQTVFRVTGNTLTVGIRATIGTKRYVLNKERIHPDKNKIFGVYFRNKLEEIDWGRCKP